MTVAEVADDIRGAQQEATPWRLATVSDLGSAGGFALQLTPHDPAGFKRELLARADAELAEALGAVRDGFRGDHRHAEWVRRRDALAAHRRELAEAGADQERTSREARQALERGDDPADAEQARDWAWSRVQGLEARTETLENLEADARRQAAAHLEWLLKQERDRLREEAIEAAALRRAELEQALQEPLAAYVAAQVLSGQAGGYSLLDPFLALPG